MDKKILSDVNVSGKKVLVRVDFNVPQDEAGHITDDNRMQAALPTIRYLLEHEAVVILMSHLGRPKGEVNLKYSLKPVAECFGGRNYAFPSQRSRFFVGEGDPLYRGSCS